MTPKERAKNEREILKLKTNIRLNHTIDDLRNRITEYDTFIENLVLIYPEIAEMDDYLELMELVEYDNTISEVDYSQNKGNK